jgi:hypothetical protein
VRALSICLCQLWRRILAAAPAVVRAQLDAEELAHLAVEVGDVGLGAADHADLDVALRRQMFGQDTQGDRLAGAGAPVTRAKPPSPASWATRQQKDGGAR